MKFNVLFTLTSLCWILYACPPSKVTRDLDKIKDNNMDFPDLREQYYEGIYFKLSDLFSDDYNDEYVIKDDAMTKAIYDIDVNFSVEVFSKDEAELIQYTFEDEIDLIDAVHDNYVYKRLETFEDGSASIKKKFDKCKFPCLIQIVEGTSSYYGEASTYMMATIEANNKYYVIHLIGVEKNMGYLYDDFEAIVESVTT